MNKKVYARIALSLLLALAVLAGCLFGMNTQARPAVASGKVDGYATYLFMYAANVTTAQTGSGKVVADYGWLDCYITLDMEAGNQSIIVTMQHSPDNSVWVSYAAFTAQAADGTAYYGIPITGTYMRATTAISTTAANYTQTVKCTAKDLTR